MWQSAFDPTGISESIAAASAAATSAASTGAAAATTGAATSATAGAAAGAGAASAGGVAAAGATGAGVAGTGITTSQAALGAIALGTTLQVGGQMKAQGAERQQQQLQYQRQQADTIRMSRIALANSQNSAANQGATGTSAAQGAEGGIESQLGSNLSFLDKYSDFSKKASNGLMFAGMGQQLERTGSQVFANSNRISNIFG